LTHTDPDYAQLRQSISEAGLGLDTIAEMIAAPVILLFGARVLRWAIQRLLQAPHAVRPQPTEVTTRALALSGLGFIAGAIALLAAVTLMGQELAQISCAYHLQGQLPGWVPSKWFNSLAYYCQKKYNTGYGAFIDIISWSMAIVVLTEAMLMLGRSLRNMRAMLHKARSARVLSGEVA
jgi:hypothetical protein